MVGSAVISRALLIRGFFSVKKRRNKSSKAQFPHGRPELQLPNCQLHKKPAQYVSHLGSGTDGSS